MALSPQVLKRGSSANPPPLSQRLAKLVVQLSAAAKLANELQSLNGDATAGSSKVPLPTYVNPRNLEVKPNTAASLKRKRVDSISESTQKTHLQTKKQKLTDHTSQSPTPPPSRQSVPQKFIDLTSESPTPPPSRQSVPQKPVDHTSQSPTPLPSRQNIPQKYTLDQSRSIVFVKAQGQRTFGISITDLLRHPIDLYRGDEFMRVTGGASVILHWPGYMSFRMYVRFQPPPPMPPEPSPYISLSAPKLHTKTVEKIRFREFAQNLAEKLHSWLSILTRQPFDARAGAEWELDVVCVPPLDEVMLVALGPVGVRDEDGEETWGAVLHRVRKD